MVLAMFRNLTNLSAQVLVDLSQTEETISAERIEIHHEGDVEGEASRHASRIIAAPDC